MSNRMVYRGEGSTDGPPDLVVVGNRVFSSGLVSDRPGGLESETHRIFQLTLSTLRNAGVAPGDVVRTRAWFVEDASGAYEDAIRDTHGVVFDSPGPAFSAIRVPDLPSGAAIAIELEAVKGGAGHIKHFEPDDFSATSTAVFCDGELWISGLTATGSDIGDQIGGITADVSRALAEFGMSEADVVATRHFMLPEAQFPEPPAQWSAFMEQAIPTSAGIAVDSVGHDRLFMLECEAVQDAAKGRNNLRSGRSYEIDHNYCRSVRVEGGSVVYVAGFTSAVVGEIVRSEFDVAGQVRDTLETIRWSIEEQGMQWANLARMRAYIVGGPEKLDEAGKELDAQLEGMEVVVAIIGVPTLARPEVVVEIEATAAV